MPEQQKILKYNEKKLFIEKIHRLPKTTIRKTYARIL